MGLTRWLTRNARTAGGRRRTGSRPEVEFLEERTLLAAELIVNGDFTQGPVGFSTGYRHSPSSITDVGTYAVVTNPRLVHPDAFSYGDHTTGSGLMMAVDGAIIPNVVVWSQTVAVTPATDYAFSTWVSTWVAISPAQLDFLFNGSSVGTFTAPATSGVWQQFTNAWNSGSATSLTIQIVDRNVSFSGNDFAIDDISLTAESSPGSVVVFGADAGAEPRVQVIDAARLVETYRFLAFDESFTGGVRVAAGDVTGDGFPDILAASGPGIESELRVYDGASPGLIPRLVNRLTPYPGFSGGLFVATGDVTRDGRADLFIAPDAGSLPEAGISPPLVLLDGATGGLLGSGWAYGTGFTGGVRIATGDVNGDGAADLVTVPGPGLKPFVVVLSGADGRLLTGFLAFEPAYTGGSFVTVGDVDADGRADFVVGSDTGLGSQVRVFDSTATGAIPPVLREFNAYPGFTGAVRVAVRDVIGGFLPEIITTPGPGMGPLAKAFNPLTGVELASALVVYDPLFQGGVFVGAG